MPPGSTILMLFKAEGNISVIGGSVGNPVAHSSYGGSEGRDTHYVM